MLFPLKWQKKSRTPKVEPISDNKQHVVKVHLQILKLINPRVQKFDNLSLTCLHGALCFQMVRVTFIRLEWPLIITIRSIRELIVTPIVYFNIINAYCSRRIALLLITGSFPLDSQREIKTRSLFALLINSKHRAHFDKNVGRLTITLLYRRERDLVLQ